MKTVYKRGLLMLNKHYTHDAKRDGLERFCKDNPRTFKATGDSKKDTQILKNVIAECIAKKQLGLLKKGTIPEVPDGLNANLSQFDNFDSQRDFMKDVLRQSRIITHNVQKVMDQNLPNETRFRKNNKVQSTTLITKPKIDR